MSTPLPINTARVRQLLEQALAELPDRPDSMTASALRHLLQCTLTAARGIDAETAADVHPPDIVGAIREALTTATMLTRQLRSTGLSS